MLLVAVLFSSTLYLPCIGGQCILSDVATASVLWEKTHLNKLMMIKMISFIRVNRKT